MDSLRVIYRRNFPLLFLHQHLSHCESIHLLETETEGTEGRIAVHFNTLDSG